MNLNDKLVPPERTDFKTKEMVGPMGDFYHAKRLEDGSYCGIKDAMRLGRHILVMHAGSDREVWYFYDKDVVMMLNEFIRITSGDDIPGGWSSRRPL